MSYDDWIIAHCRLFGMTSEDDPAIVRLWASLGARMGATPEQMMEASYTLASSGSAPDYRDKLQRAWVLTLRAELSRGQGPAPADDGPAYHCDACDGTGRVIVPNPDSLARGRWTTLAVLCRCPVGMQFRHAGTKGSLSLTLEGLSAILPDWRDRMEAHHAQDVAYAAALAASGAIRTRLHADTARLVREARQRSQRP